MCQKVLPLRISLLKSAVEGGEYLLRLLVAGRMEGSLELLGSDTHGRSRGWAPGSAGMPHLSSHHSQSFSGSSTNPSVTSWWAFCLQSLSISSPSGEWFAGMSFQ